MTDTGGEVSGSLNFKAMFFAALVRAAGWSHRKHMLGQMEQLKKKAGKRLGQGKHWMVQTFELSTVSFSRNHFLTARWQRKKKR
jgi:hypothetical protein